MQKRRKTNKKMKNHGNCTFLFFSFLFFSILFSRGILCVLLFQDFGFFVGYVVLGFWDCASLDTQDVL